MKRLLLASLLCGFAWVASAQSVTISGEIGDQTTLRDAETNARANPMCLRETGSRIVAAKNTRQGSRPVAADSPDRRCVSAHGRVYTRDDIDRAGAIDLADALRRLDTSIR